VGNGILLIEECLFFNFIFFSLLTCAYPKQLKLIIRKLATLDVMDNPQTPG
jgi:hypothetical protein